MSSFTTFYIVFLISLFSLNTYPTFSQTTSCKTLKLSKTFDNCTDLPTLSAVLHWTYTSSNSSLAVAFTASPPKPDGWVAWGLNPKTTGMQGAQVFLAHKPTSSGPVTVDTYNLISYSNISKGPISYKVTSTSAQDNSGVITIFGTWALPKGMSNLNQVWQVGPIVNGAVGKHDFSPANLKSTNVLSLSGVGPSSGPAGAPGSSPSGSGSGSGLSPSSSEGSSTLAPQSSPPNKAGERYVSGFLGLVSMFLYLF